MKRLISALSVLLVLGCKSTTEPTSSTEIALTLKQIGESSLPWTYNTELGLQVKAGKVVLKSDSTFIDVLTYDYVFNGSKLVQTDTIKGRYHVQYSAIALENDGTGTFDGQQLALFFDQIWLYHK